MTYSEAHNEVRKGRGHIVIEGKVFRTYKVANHTYLVYYGLKIALRFHQTNVITFYPNGRIVLNSGGWKTPSTKERVNRYLPTGYSLWQGKGLWYLSL